MDGKQKNEHARKSRAGKLLTAYLGEISEEKTEAIDHPFQGCIMSTKAEALARLIWKEALGYSEEDPITQKIIVRSPDRAMMSMIFDRLEGKAPPTIPTDPGKLSVHGRVTEESKKRISKAGGMKDAGDRGTKADS